MRQIMCECDVPINVREPCDDCSRWVCEDCRQYKFETLFDGESYSVGILCDRCWSNYSTQEERIMFDLQLLIVFAIIIFFLGCASLVINPISGLVIIGFSIVMGYISAKTLYSLQPNNS